jgi:TatD DNase family protein
LPPEAIVLETDAPDIPPVWLKGEHGGRNMPSELPRIADVLAELRGVECAEVERFTTGNAVSTLGLPVVV